MRRLVIDAHAFLGWFGPDSAARVLRREFEAGGLAVYAPSWFRVHVLELAAADDLTADQLKHLAAELDRLQFEIEDPPATELAAWLARGVDARHAQYAALAVALDLPLVTTDRELLRVAAGVATEPA